MKRRQFITLLGGAAAAWPLAALAQQAAVPVIGFLNGASASGSEPFVAAFRRGLSESGYLEGRDFTIEYRWAEGQFDRLPSLANELVRRQVSLIVACGGDNPAYAAKAATSSIPIVFLVGIDPSKVGLVAGIGRPGGNATGVSLLTEETITKQIDVLLGLLPRLLAIGVLVDSDNTNAQIQIEEAQRAARARGLRLVVVKAHSEQELDAAFSTLAAEKVGALLVGASGIFIYNLRNQLVALASRHALPTMYFQRIFVEAGGLISYGPDVPFIYRQVGIYAASILKGTKPNDLPVLLPTKFELVINLKAARELHLEVPPTLLALTDEVIE